MAICWFVASYRAPTGGFQAHTVTVQNNVSASALQEKEQSTDMLSNSQLTCFWDLQFDVHSADLWHKRTQYQCYLNTAIIAYYADCSINGSFKQLQILHTDKSFLLNLANMYKTEGTVV